MSLGQEKSAKSEVKPMKEKKEGHVKVLYISERRWPKEKNALQQQENSS